MLKISQKDVVNYIARLLQCKVCGNLSRYIIISGICNTLINI